MRFQARESVIVFSMQIVATEKKRMMILSTLAAGLGSTRVTPGCLAANIYRDVENGKVLMLVEEWESREEFDRQLDSEKLKTLVAAMETSSEAPVVHIDDVTREGGIHRLPFRRSGG
jgi:quinol monooxygenase YgiN